MLLRYLSPAALVLLGTGSAMAQDHATAAINDPRSHGVVGDTKLSLNEVILLNKRVLLQSSLSAAEQGQINGFGGDVAIANIDATIVPRITLERNLDTIDDTAHGLNLVGVGGQPIIDLAGTRGIVINSNFADVRNVVLENAAIAIDITQGNAIYGSVVDSVTFRNISNTAVRVATPTDGDTTQLTIERSLFDGVPNGFEWFDTGTNRRGSLTVQGSTFRNCNYGVRVHLGPGGVLTSAMHRLRLQQCTHGIAFERPTATDTRSVVLTSLHALITGAQSAFSFQGHTGSNDHLDFHMAEFAGSKHALRVWPAGAGTTGLLEDSRIDGPAETLGLGNFTLSNLRARGASWTFGGTVPQVVSTTIFDGMIVGTSEGQPLTLNGCRFVGGGIAGTAAAPVSVNNTYLGSATVGSYVSANGSLPAPQLGSCDASPLEPRINTTAALTTDLPPNLFGQWFFGLAETLPLLGPQPIHLYFWLSLHVPLPAIVAGNSQLPLQIPNNPNLIGRSWIAQLAVFPGPGVSAPPLNLPPGRWIVVR